MHPALYQSLVTNVLAPHARVVRAYEVFSRGIALMTIDRIKLTMNAPLMLR